MNSGEKPHIRVTPREVQVWRTAAAGRTAEESAAELGICRKTIEVYRHRLMRKLHLRNRVELVVLGLRLDVVSLREIPMPEVIVELPGESR